MISSLSEAISLLGKWKAEEATILLVVSDGPPDDPGEFLFGVRGSVTELSGSWVEVASGINRCRLRLDLPGTFFAYVEARDRRLLIGNKDREDVERIFEGCLSVNFPDGTFSVFNVLREVDGKEEE